MANKLYEESNIQAIADAIRAKGQTGTMTVSQMAGKIAAIGGDGTYTVKLKNNGHVSYAYVRYGSTVYYTWGDEITVNAGEKIYIKAYAGSSNNIYINGNSVPGGVNEFAYTVNNDVAVSFDVAIGDGATVRLATNGYVYTEDKTITSNGTVTAGTGYDGLGTVIVAIPTYDGTVV